MNTDIVLLRKAQAGNKEAFGELVLRYQKQIYRLAYKILSNTSDAADIAQESFLKAYRNLQNLKNPNKFAQWLMRIATNECYSWIRRRQDKLMKVEEELLCKSALRHPPAPDEVLIKRELYQRIMAAIAALPELEQKVIQMYYLEGHSYKEIQEELSITKGTLGRRLHQARAKLRQKLQAACQGFVAFLSDGFNRIGTSFVAKQAGTSSVIAFSTAKYLVISLLVHLTLFTTAPLLDGISGYFQNGGTHSEKAPVAVALLSSMKSSDNHTGLHLRYGNAPDSLSSPSSPPVAKMKHPLQRTITKSPSTQEARNRFNLPIPALVKVFGTDDKPKIQNASSPEPLLSSSSNDLASPPGENAIPVIPDYASIQSAPSGTKRTRFAQGFLGQTDSPVSFDVDAQTTISSNNATTAGIAFAEEPPLILKGHRKQATKIAFSPDGRLLASTSGDRILRLWDVATGEVNIIPRHIYSFDFSPDGRWLATNSPWEEQILLWDISEQRTIEIPAFKRISDLCFSPDGMLLAAVSDIKVFFWDMTSQKEIIPFEMMRHGFSRSYSAIAFSPDGKFFVGGTGLGWIELWNLAEKRPMMMPSGYFGGSSGMNRNNAIQFSQDGRLLAASDGWKNLALWDVSSMRMKFAVNDFIGRGVAFSPDSSFLASGVELRDISTGQIVQTFGGLPPVAFSPDGKWLATQSENNNILLWRIDRLEQAGLHKNVAPGKIVFISDRDAGKKIKNAIYIMDADGSGQVKLAYPPKKRKSVGGVSVSPDGKKIAFHAIDASKKVDIWVMDVDGENQRRLTSGHNASNPTWSPDGSRIAFESGIPPRTDIYVMNADGTNAVNLTNNGADNQEPSWSPDGKKIIFSAKKKRTRIRNLRNLYVIHLENKQIFRLTKNTKTGQQSRQASWSPDGRYIAYIHNSVLFVMDASGKNPRKLIGNALHPTWSPEGTKIAFVSKNEIYAIDVGGRILTKLTHNKERDSKPSWLIP